MDRASPLAAFWRSRTGRLLKLLATFVGIYMMYTGATGRELLWKTGPGIIGDVSRRLGDAFTGDVGRWVLVGVGLVVLLLAWGPTAYANARPHLWRKSPPVKLPSQALERPAVRSFPTVTMAFRPISLVAWDETGDFLLFMDADVTNQEEAHRVRLKLKLMLETEEIAGSLELQEMNQLPKGEKTLISPISLAPEDGVSGYLRFLWPHQYNELPGVPPAPLHTGLVMEVTDLASGAAPIRIRLPGSHPKAGRLRTSRGRAAPG